MPKFAHMSDIHVGAFRQPELKSLVLDAFEAAIDRCIADRVSFVVMSGDIFDSNIPDLSSVRRAAEKMKQAIDSGLRFYAIYGSHDFSPNYSSIVDVLNGAGLFTKAETMSNAEGRVVLSFVQDPSGPKICGISGRKLSLDRDEYELLDRASLEAEGGFKVFVFHGALEELKPPLLEKMEAMPVERLPSNFNYYAGGHVHDRSLTSLPGHPNIAFPGPLFATDYSELLRLAQGEERGFFMVDFDESQVNDVKFVPVKVCDPVEIHYSAEGKSSSQASEELASLAGEVDVKGKVVLLTVEGTLSEGKTSDIDFYSIRKRLASTRPLIVLSSTTHLTSKELLQKPPAKALHVTERELFEREITKFASEEPKLRGESGVSTAVDLLRVLKQGRKENENKSEFEDRTVEAGLAVLGLGERE